MRPETKALYPDNWQMISKAVIRHRGKVCADCGARKGHTSKILTVHHNDYDPSNNSLANLVVLCQGCHLRRQARDLAEATKYHRGLILIRMGQLVLPGLELEMPKVPARVLEGKALATRARYEQYAQRGT